MQSDGGSCCHHGEGGSGPSEASLAAAAAAVKRMGLPPEAVGSLAGLPEWVWEQPPQKQDDIVASVLHQLQKSQQVQVRHVPSYSPPPTMSTSHHTISLRRSCHAHPAGRQGRLCLALRTKARRCFPLGRIGAQPRIRGVSRRRHFYWAHPCPHQPINQCTAAAPTEPSKTAATTRCGR